MRAVFLDEGLSLKDVPLGALADGEARIRVLLAGICNTDLELGRGYKDFRGIPGHEFVGVVEDCQEASDGFDRAPQGGGGGGPPALHP